MNAKLRSRESSFNLSGLASAKRKEYNALYDPNMRHFFESSNRQSFLYQTGQIDSHGRVIDTDKNKSKIAILEKEFAMAEKVEQRRRQEEIEMRYRVQRKRFHELENTRKAEYLMKIKRDQDFNKELNSIMRASFSGSRSSTRNSAVPDKLNFESFFITDS